jgi:hypothetical protein
MRDHLDAALRLVGGGLFFREINLEALPESDARRGWPAPTVLVDGRDLFGMEPRGGHAIGCRVYPGGVPAADVITQRLRAAAGR